MNTEQAAKIKMLSAMVIFGTVGLFVRLVSLPSSVVAMARGAIGLCFLLLVMAARKKRLDGAAVRRNLPVLIMSGACLGINWILLFESYRFTTVATATLCYYMGPMLVIAASPLLFHERLTGRRLGCVLAALAGIVLVSGITGGTADEAALARNPKGIAFGLAAAAFYAGVVLLNKKLGKIDAYDKTVVQLGASSAVLLPYVLLTTDMSALAMAPAGWAALAVLGVVHTGLAYALYFGSLGDLRAQTAALMSYLDPVVAIVLSALLLREPMGVSGALGAALVLGAAVVSELPGHSAAKSGK